MGPVSDPAPKSRIAARMRFEDPGKFLEFYEKQLVANVVGLRHGGAVAVGAEVLLSLQPPGHSIALALVGTAEKVTPRPDGSNRLRVALTLSPESQAWLEAYVTGLRTGLEHGASASQSVVGESMIGESVILEGQRAASGPISTVPVPPPASAGPTIEDEARTRAARIDNLTYYQIVGVPADAPVERVRSAYHDLTRRFHPDLFFDQSATLRADVGRFYRRLNEAYSVLKDPNRRRMYDKGLSGPAHTWTLRLTEEAEQRAQRQRRVRRGSTAVGQTYWKLAREVLERARESESSIRPALRESARLLRMAMTFEPENDHFRHALDHVVYRLSVADDD